MTLEELQAKFLEQQEQLNKLTEDNKNYKIQIEEKTTREKQLEEYNQLLFSKVATPITKEDENKKADDEELKNFIGEKVYNAMSEKDLVNIKNIMNGDDE